MFHSFPSPLLCRLVFPILAVVLTSSPFPLTIKLYGLNIHPGSLTPSFHFRTFHYTAKTGASRVSVLPLLEAEKEWFTVEVDGEEVKSGAASREVILRKNLDEHTFIIRVSAPRFQTSTYYIHVTRSTHWTFWRLFGLLVGLLLMFLVIAALLYIIFLARQQSAWPFGNAPLVITWTADRNYILLPGQPEA